MRTLLIDGDVVAYRFSTAAEEAIDWGDDQWTLHSDLGKAGTLAAAHLDELLEDILDVD